jgi:hypothetical protein
MSGTILTTLIAVLLFSAPDPAGAQNPVDPPDFSKVHDPSLSPKSPVSVGHYCQDSTGKTVTSHEESFSDCVRELHDGSRGAGDANSHHLGVQIHLDRVD